jgi:arsenite-transporting ATPase
VTNGDPLSNLVAKSLWGGAQQIGLTVKGVFLNSRGATQDIGTEFEPLPVTTLPTYSENHWDSLVESIPDIRSTQNVPEPLKIDLPARQVKLFLPGFDKKEVKLTQYGPEITIEAGDQRRNISLPAPLSGQPVKGAKFQNGYLIISF